MNDLCFAKACLPHVCVGSPSHCCTSPPPPESKPCPDKSLPAQSGNLHTLGPQTAEEDRGSRLGRGTKRTVWLEPSSLRVFEITLSYTHIITPGHLQLHSAFTESLFDSMTGSTIARVLVALCIGSAVNCMPRGTHRDRRQTHQHHVPSVSQGKPFVREWVSECSSLWTSNPRPEWGVGVRKF